MRLAGIVRDGKVFDVRTSASRANTLRYELVLDGAVYNVIELGISGSVAAGVLELIERDGLVQTLAKLNADFALALYDRLDDVLWLARDRFGVVPLYFLRSAAQRAFAQTAGGVSEIASVRLEVDEAFVARFAGNHYRGIAISPTASPYKNIAQIAPASVVRLDGRSVQTLSYWSLKEQPNWQSTPEKLAEEYKSLILDAIKIRLAGKARHAFTLSGGMDSSTIAASAAAQLGGPQAAFSVIYDDPTFDESSDIKPMLGSRIEPWTTVKIGNPDVFGLIQELVLIHDEPVVTATWLSHYLLTQEVAAQNFTTLWGGLGGDELNAGEYLYFIYYFADLKRAGEDKVLESEIAAWVKYHDHPLYRKSAAIAAREMMRMVDLEQPGVCRPDSKRLHKYHQALTNEWAERAHEVASAESPFSSYLKNRTYQDLTRETLPCCLRAEERHTAAAGLSRRVPFLDVRLVEFMYRVPGNFKIRRGVTKYLLREAMRGILPEQTRVRIKKTGWNAPAHRWFTGPGREQLLDLIRSQRTRQRGIYDMDAVEKIIAEHEEIVKLGYVQENHMMFLWQLVNLELWLRYVEERSYAAATV